MLCHQFTQSRHLQGDRGDKVKIGIGKAHATTSISYQPSPEVVQKPHLHFASRVALLQDGPHRFFVENVGIVELK